MRTFNNTEIVMKIIGEIKPVGIMDKDFERLNNLRELCELTETLIDKIGSITWYEDSCQSSVKDCGEYASNWMKKNIKQA